MSARRRVARAGPSAGVLPRRQRCAVEIVGMLLAVIAVVGVVEQAAYPGVLHEAVAQETWGIEAPAGVFDVALNASEGVGAVDVPSIFEDEVFSLEGHSDIRTDAQSGLVGFTCSGQAADTFTALSKELANKGWTSIESGSAMCGTFVKDVGMYCWVFVSCVQVGDSTSVVVQSAMTDEGSR